MRTPRQAEVVSATSTREAGTVFAPWSCMKKTPTNQQRSRKYGGSSSFVDAGQPSKAPRQDEEGQEFIGSAGGEAGAADGSSAQQGISNRPAKDEHAFPEPDEPAPQAGPESVDEGPKQVGGNRGQV